MQLPLHEREAERIRLRILIAGDRLRMENVGFNGMPLRQPPAQLPAAAAAMENANRPPPPRRRAHLPIQNYYQLVTLFNILVAIILIVFFSYIISSYPALVAPVRLPRTYKSPLQRPRKYKRVPRKLTPTPDAADID
jgi:hypothetical protein